MEVYNNKKTTTKKKPSESRNLVCKYVARQH